MKIAYIVFAGTANYTPANGFDEILDLLPYLQNKGLDIQAEIWDDPNVDWIRYEVALLKTPWDYHLKFAQFNLWLKKIEDLNIKLLNDYRIVRWNMDKHYLDDIIKSGFEVIASVFIDRGWTGDPDLLFEQVGSNKLIIKPCISGGSRDTMVFSKTTDATARENVLNLVSQGDFIVQPFMEQIRQGEWSFIFLNGVYSHTIIKKPKSGDFRVQQIFGGTIQTVIPEQHYIETAATYIARFASDTLYARVDGIMIDGKFVLMELELVEPFLYLSYDPDAPERYYIVLSNQLSSLKTK